MYIPLFPIFFEHTTHTASPQTAGHVSVGGLRCAIKATKGHVSHHPGISGAQEEEEGAVPVLPYKTFPDIDSLVLARESVSAAVYSYAKGRLY